MKCSRGETATNIAFSIANKHSRVAGPPTTDETRTCSCNKQQQPQTSKMTETPLGVVDSEHELSPKNKVSSSKSEKRVRPQLPEKQPSKQQPLSEPQPERIHQHDDQHISLFVRFDNVEVFDGPEHEQHPRIPVPHGGERESGDAVRVRLSPPDKTDVRAAVEVVPRRSGGSGEESEDKTRWHEVSRPICLTVEKKCHRLKFEFDYANKLVAELVADSCGADGVDAGCPGSFLGLSEMALFPEQYSEGEVVMVLHPVTRKAHR